MAIPVTHTLKIREVNDPSKPYKFALSCSCQWQGLAHTRLVAERFLASHAYEQTIRGNEVIIDRGLPETKDVAEAVVAEVNEKLMEDVQKVIDTPVTEENVNEPLEAVFPVAGTQVDG